MTARTREENNTGKRIGDLGEPIESSEQALQRGTGAKIPKKSGTSHVTL